MPFDDTQPPIFGGGGGHGPTPVQLLVKAFAEAWVRADKSEDEEVLEDVYAKWDALQGEPSKDALDIIFKLSAFKIRYDSVVISYSVICESDVLHLDTLAMEAVDALYQHISMDG